MPRKLLAYETAADLSMNQRFEVKQDISAANEILKNKELSSF
jgi:hypothetical protein